MPGGSELLLPLQWQPVPGCPEALVYPLIRKVDKVSSNSYLIQTPNALVLIDPGGLREQAMHLASVILESRAASARPLFVILTHAHVDHYLAALSVPLLTDPEIAVIAVQEYGAGPLEHGDRRLTLAEMLGHEIAPLRIDLRLLAAANSEAGGIPTRDTYANGATVTVLRRPPKSGLLHDQLVVGGGLPLEVYHTPGHSPDSCCIRIGRLLFTGDLLFAASPGVAGTPGWDQEALLRSLEAMRTLLSCDRIEVICPGHGRVLSADDAARMLVALQRDARGLTGIAELNPDRIRRTAAFAEDCMEQVNEIFTLMMGRLYYVSHLMDELGESGTAAGLQALIPSDAIDDLLETFDTFNREYHSGRYVPLDIALKGGQVIGKLERSFNRDALAQVIDPSLVRRAGRLLGDYTTMLSGFDPPRDIAVHDLRALLETGIATHTVHPCSDDDLLASADDDAAFERMLLARIGMSPLLSGIEVDLITGTEPLSVQVDRDRFLDLVTYLLEEFVGTGAYAVAVHAGRESETAVVAISAAYGAGPPVGGRPRRFLYGLCERSGGVLDFGGIPGTRRVTIRFSGAV